MKKLLTLVVTSIIGMSLQARAEEKLSAVECLDLKTMKENAGGILKVGAYGTAGRYIPSAPMPYKKSSDDRESVDERIQEATEPLRAEIDRLHQKLDDVQSKQMSDRIDQNMRAAQQRRDKLNALYKAQNCDRFFTRLNRAISTGVIEPSDESD